VNTNRLATIIGGVIIIAVVALGWVVGVSPLLTAAQAADDERAGIETQNQAHQAELIRKMQQFADIGLYEAKLKILQLAVSEDDELSSFYRSVDYCLTATGAILDVINTSEAEQFGGGGGAAPVEGSEPLAVGTTLAPKFFSIPVTITLPGDGNVSLAFAACMQEAQGRLFFINTMTYQGTGGDETTTISGYIFQVKDPESVVIAPPADEGTTDPNSPTPTPSDAASPAPSASPSASPSTEPAS
jgi:hypothetical protein